MTVYPRTVRSLATDVNTRRKRYYRSLWTLDVAGPFCWLASRRWSHGARSAIGTALANQVSSLLGTAVHSRMTDGETTIHLDVVITDELRHHLIKQTYRKETA